MSDIITDPGNWTEEYEFVDPQKQTTAPSREELEEQIKAATEKAKQQEKEIAVLQEQANTSKALLTGIEKLNTTMSQPQQPIVVQDQQVPETDDPNARWFDQPAQAAQDLLDKKLQDVTASYQQNITRLKMQISRSNIQNHPVYGNVMNTYKDEIEQTIAATEPALLAQIDDPYLMAAQTVAGRHLDDVIKMHNSAVKSETQPADRAQSLTPPFTEQSNTTPSNKTPRQIVMTQELKDLKKRAAIIGMPFNEYIKRMNINGKT